MIVVTAIIAFLASMLLPALQNARAKGLQTTCLSHLKQLGTGAQMYVSDQEQRLPRSRDVSPWADDPRPKYLDHIQTYVPDDNAMLCPLRPTQAFGSGQGRRKWGYGYACNGNSANGRQIISVRNPSGKILLGDALHNDWRVMPRWWGAACNYWWSSPGIDEKSGQVGDAKGALSKETGTGLRT
jgi:type II secretory pathway pseudopilin PulG